jgi:hypothetical protein
VDENSFRSAEYELIKAMRDLDFAKAWVRIRQGELNVAIRALTSTGPCGGGLLKFEERSRAMKQASELYRRAVEAFNAACGRDRATTIPFAPKVATH